MEAKKVSKALLGRLPAYLDYLKSLPEHTANISATRIAEALGYGDVLVRKDLAKVSGSGRCKTGHQREVLIQNIEAFLDCSETTNAVIVGAGKLGQALLDYCGFAESGLHILSGFDIAPDKTKTTGGIQILPMDKLADFCYEYHVHMAIITVPAEHAQQVCDTLVSCGIEAIWNFAPVRLKVPAHILVQNENLAVSLTALRMQLNARKKAK